MKTKITYVANKFLKWKAKALYILYLHYKVDMNIDILKEDETYS